MKNLILFCKNAIFIRNIFIVISFIISSCVSKAKEGANLHIYNRSDSDIFIIDKFSFENLDRNNKIEIFTYGFSGSKSDKRPYLKPEYVTMYTNKTIFFSLKDYNNNRAYNSIIFYIVKRSDINKTKQEILRDKLYDSIEISLKDFHQKGANNHLYFEKNIVEFKNY